MDSSDPCLCLQIAMWYCLFFSSPPHPKFFVLNKSELQGLLWKDSKMIPAIPYQLNRKQRNCFNLQSIDFEGLHVIAVINSSLADLMTARDFHPNFANSYKHIFFSLNVD